MALIFCYHLCFFISRHSFISSENFLCIEELLNEISTATLCLFPEFSKYQTLKNQMLTNPKRTKYTFYFRIEIQSTRPYI